MITYNDSGATLSADWLTAVKLHLRVDHSTEDTLIATYIRAAYDMAESYTRQALVSRTFTAYYDCFDTVMKINRTPISAVGSIKYYDSDNALQTIADTNYYYNLNDQPLRISWASGYTPPDIITKAGAVEIAFTAGYSSYANIPSNIKSAIFLIVGHLYENREEVVVGRTANQLPKAAEYLMDANRIYLH